MKQIYVKWVDSASCHIEWTLIKDVDESKFFCETIGFLVKECKDQIHVANSIYGSGTSCCMVMSIPKVSIVKRKYIKK